MITFLPSAPVAISPPIRALSPLRTRRRVEMFPNELGVGAGVGVGVDVGVGDAAGVALGVGVTPGVGVGNPDDPVRRARQMRVIPLYLLNIPPTRSFPSSWMAS